MVHYRVQWLRQIMHTVPCIFLYRVVLAYRMRWRCNREEVVACLSSISFVQMNMRNEGAALNYLKEALKIRKEKLGKDHDSSVTHTIIWLISFVLLANVKMLDIIYGKP